MAFFINRTNSGVWIEAAVAEEDNDVGTSSMLDILYRVSKDVVLWMCEDMLFNRMIKCGCGSNRWSRTQKWRLSRTIWCMSLQSIGFIVEVRDVIA